MSVYSDTRRREIAGQARTLHERLDGPPNERPPSEPEPPFDPDEVLDVWADQFPDEAAFSDRLAREGLTESAIRERIVETLWPEEEPLPGWIDDLESLVEHVEGYEAGDESDVPVPENADEIPFVDLLVAIVDYARSQLDENAVQPGGISQLQLWLLSRLDDLCVRALYVEFKKFVEFHDPELAKTGPEDVDDPGTEYYDKFVDVVFEEGFRKLPLEYPALARLLVRMIDGWVDAVETVLRRLDADRDALEDRFGVEGNVTALEPLADDVHAGGQTPVRVVFESGAVVYKPRPVDAGIVLYELLDRLDTSLETPGFRAPTYLPREEYGWMEVIEYRDAPDATAVERYYERAGVLLCLGYVLDMPDCQFENVVTTGDQPTIVDAETLLHPHLDPLANSYGTGVAWAAENTALRSALLPWTVGHRDDEDSDLPKSALVAGLGASSETVAISDVKKPFVEAANTDVMSVGNRSPTVERSGNTLTLDGEDQPPDRNVEALLRGFEDAYRTVHRLHEEGRFLSEILDPKLVSGVENRLVFRSTDRYKSILRRSRATSPLRDGAMLGVEFEWLAVPFFDGEIEDARYWDLYEAERRALVRRDVPRFTSRTDETTIYHDGEPTGVEADTAGYRRCRERLDEMDEADLRRQTWIVRRCLDDSIFRRDPPSSDGTATDDELGRLAVESGDAICDAAIETDAGPRWVAFVGEDMPQICLSPADESLYDGRAGIGLAAAALYDRTGHERFSDLATGALDPIAENEGPPMEFLGLKGTGSVVYALSVAAELLDRPEYRDAAAERARRITDDRLEADETFDLIDGTAGALLGLLAHYERFGGDPIRERAVACGDRLLDGRVEVEGHRVWTTGHDDPVPGMAHGVSGIAYALARLAAAVDDDRYAAPAREALAYEDILYVPERSNYAIPLDPGIAAFEAESAPDEGDAVWFHDQWCYGRTGCALARIGIGSCLGDETLIAEANDLLSATVEADVHPYDHLCCGTFGRAIAVLEAARRTDRDETDARAVAGQALARRDETGALSCPGHGELVSNPMLFEGVAGTAYAAVRLREPDALPCLLLLE